MDISKITQNIILRDGVKYFDHTASSLAYKPIEDEILRLLHTYSNTHSESSELARVTNEIYQRSRVQLKHILKLNNKFSIFPCGFGATAAIKKFQELMGIYIPPKTKKILNINKIELKNLPLVIISPFEHHSNEISFKEGLCEVVRVPLDGRGVMDYDALDEILKANKGRKIIGSFSIASNVTGVMNDYKRIYLSIKSHGGVVAFDATASMPHLDIDSSFYDAMFCASHKLLGGVQGCGILVIKNSLCDLDEPTFAGGGVVQYVNKNKIVYKIDKEELEDAGTPGILALARTYLAFKLRNDIGLEFIKSRETELGEYFLEKVNRLDDITLYVKNLSLNERLPIFAFNVKGFNPYDFSAILSQKYSVETRAGCACAGPYAHELLGGDPQTKGKIFNPNDKPNFIRAGVHFTHSKDDIDYLISAMKAVIKKRGRIKFTQGEYLC